jgi:hypothetical protein
MPYIIRKLRNKNLYKLSNKLTGVVHSQHTTKAKAEAQMRLLNAIDNNPNFKPRK